MKYPDNLKTRKQRIAYWCFKQLYTRSVGQGQVIGRFTNMIPELGISIILIERFTPFRFNIFTLVLVGIGTFAVAWLIGAWWMKWSLDKIDSQVSSERNPIMMDIHKNSVKEREEL